MTCAITLLSPADGGVVTKRISAGGVTPAPQSTWYRASSVTLNGFSDLASALTQLSSMPTWLVVRGSVLPGVNPENMRRAHVPPYATLEETPRQWVLLDLDSVRPDVPGEVFAAAVAEWAAVARRMLPECFHDAACFYQATSSAGYKPGLRLRLGFWLSRAVSSAEWKAWARGWDVKVDTSLFTPSQPHYTAAPVLDGVSDPCAGRRVGTLPGGDVTIPAVLVDPREGDKAGEDLRRTCRRLVKTEAGERNNALNRAAYRLAFAHAPESLPDAVLEAALTEAAAGWGADVLDHHTADTMRRGIRDGRARRAREYDGWRGQLARDKDGATRATEANIGLFIEFHPDFTGRLAAESRTGSPFWVTPPPWDTAPRPYRDADTSAIVRWFQTQALVDAKPGWVEHAVVAAAVQREYDPLTTWLESLPAWDGRARAETLFIRYLGAEDCEYTRAATRLWLLQARQRAFASMESPVKADHTVVLESAEQGIGKSTVCRVLCPWPSLFVDRLPPLVNKDAQLALSRAWIVELQEMTQRAESADAVKAFLTSLYDTVRRPYAKETVDIARRCVFVGTTNDPEYSADPSGARRFLPIECTGRPVDERLSIEARLAEERTQLWAEVMAWQDAVAALPEHLHDEALRRQANVRDVSLLEEHLGEALANRVLGGDWKAGDLSQDGRVLRCTALQAAGLLPGMLTTRDGKRVSAALRALGWAQKRVSGTDRRRLYYPPAGWVYAVSMQEQKTAN